MYFMWIFIYCVLIQSVLPESVPPDHLQVQFYMNNTQNQNNVSELIKCQNARDVVEIISVRYSCVFNDSSSEQERTDLEMNVTNKVAFVFARICNGRNACKFTHSDSERSTFFNASKICTPAPSAISFNIEYFCLRREFIIDICQQPETYHNPYIYSSGYPKNLPKYAHECGCILTGRQGRYPHIEAVELILLGKQTGDEQLEFTFMRTNGTPAMNKFIYHNPNHSDSQYNTRRDMSQDDLSGTNIAEWEAIEFTFTRTNNGTSSGRFMFKFGQYTAVNCSSLDTNATAATLDSSEEYDISTNGGTNSVQTMNNGYTTTKTTIIQESSLSLLNTMSTVVYDTTPANYPKDKQTVSKQGQDTGLIAGVVSAAVVALGVVIFLVVVVFRKRHQKERYGGSPYITSDQDNSQGSLAAAALTELVDKNTTNANNYAYSNQAHTEQSSGIETRTVTSSFIAPSGGELQQHFTDPPAGGNQTEQFISIDTRTDTSSFVAPSGGESQEHSNDPAEESRPSSGTEKMTAISSFISSSGGELQEHSTNPLGGGDQSEPSSATETNSFVVPSGRELQEHSTDQPGERDHCDDSPILQHKNSLYIGAVSIPHNESPVVDHRNSSYVGAVQNGMLLSEQPYVSTASIRHNESPVIDHRNSVYVGAEADTKMVATKHKQQVPSDSSFSADSDVSTTDIDENKGQTAQPIEDDHVSVYSLINDAEVNPDSGPVATDDGSYEQAIEVIASQYAAADNSSISASDSSGSGNTDPDSSKIGPRDRRTFPDYAYAYAKTRGGGLSLRADPRPSNNQDPYSYIQIGDVAKPVKPKPEVIPETEGDYPYAYADLRGRIIPGITEHVRVPGYDLEGDISNPTDESVADSQLNLSKGQYTLEKPVPGKNL